MPKLAEEHKNRSVNNADFEMCNALYMASTCDAMLLKIPNIEMCTACSEPNMNTAM